MSGGSSIVINGPAGNTGFNVGRTGTGLARVTGSTIDVGGGRSMSAAARAPTG